MAKKIKTVIKLQIPAQKATPAPPVGPALGQHGLNIAEFCQKFNAATKDRTAGEVAPAQITVYEDRTYTFIVKTAPASEMLKKAAGIEKGSGSSLKQKVGKVTKAQVREIAQKKLPDLNTENVEAAMKIIEGSARQMGITVTE
ncbi:50S ribosomal protein L11 [Candidatus Uhrbacteria bacterium]|nr:50S ribosomal protein L11 [Candidatus Uhrbacteria bacterium]